MAGQLVGPSDSELKKLTEQFVCVRLVQMGGVDLSLFQFDPFLSWAVFFMNGDKTIYGRYGRAHPTTKRNKKDSNPNHTTKGLKAAMKRALAIHKRYAADPADYQPALEGKRGAPPRWKYAEKTPAARKYKRLKRTRSGEKGCLHCHEVQRTAIDSYFMKKIPLPDSMLWMYPRPHVLGLEMDPDHSARVTRVADGSFASSAGVTSGDDIVSLGGQPLVSIADVQWVLHNYPDEGGAMPIVVSRDGKTVEMEMRLSDGWRRKEDWVWRYRVAGYASWLWAGVSFQDHAQGVLVANRAPGWFKRANAEPKRKLRRGDVIVKVDKKSGMDRSELLAYLMREKRLGSEVRFDILRNGKPETVKFRIPKKQPEVQGY
ncbi:MAG: PDZ domain-containing protein [Planctomycetota bacterium]|jgi:hypothetical protein